MVAMFIFGSLMAVAFVAALVIAAFADRRRAIQVDSDGTRFAAAPLNPKLPWL
ncbi:MAG: hypothetical protein NTV23_07905 [Propionibacteriales bacterium]|nr:hypothetical protein [Propionibacteriales bacterium]